MAKFNELQQIKRHFFAMRNGVIADKLRKCGSPYKIIFGLNLPQIKEIAQNIVPSNQLFNDLWANNSTRESKILAPMLLNLNDVDFNMALMLIDTSTDSECIDMLCHNLLKRVGFREALIDECITSPLFNRQLAALRLAQSTVNPTQEFVEMVSNRLKKSEFPLIKRLRESYLMDMAFFFPSLHIN